MEAAQQQHDQQPKDEPSLPDDNEGGPPPSKAGFFVMELVWERPPGGLVVTHCHDDSGCCGCSRQ